jgi:nucleotide-binding universal stress UspA family protein
MFPPKSIIFPVDFSQRCSGGARMVEVFAGHFEAEITLLHVVEPPTYSDVAIDNTPLAQRELESWLGSELKHFSVRRVLTHGDAATRITEYANSGRFDLVMMPTHGYGGFRRLVLGSVTARVLDHVNAPVCTGVHMECVPVLEKIEIRNIVCAVDLGKQSCPAMALARGLAEAFGARLTVVHALAEVQETTSLGCDQDWRIAVERDAVERIANLQQSLGMEADQVVASGEAPRVVHDTATRVAANLLVIGRSQRQGVLGRLRANAYSIIRQSPCPVISV